MVVERQPLSPETSSPEHQCQNGSIKRVRATPAIYRPPAARKLEALGAQVKQTPNVISAVATSPITPVSSKSERTRSGTRQRRPDLQVYVPRAKRASMVDQNVTERHVAHHEMPINQEVLCRVKRNSVDLPSKFQNTSNTANFDKTCHILTLPASINDNPKKNISKQMEIDNSITEDNTNSLLTEDCDLNDLSEKYNSECLMSKNSGSCKISRSVGCETEEFCGAQNCRNLEKTNSESEDQSGYPSVDSNEDSCDSGLCNKRNCNDEVALSESNDLNVVLVRDSNQSDNDEVHFDDHGKCMDNKTELLDEIKDSVVGSDNFVSYHETDVVTKGESNEKNYIHKEQENKKKKKIIRRNYVSDILVISDPKPLPQSIHTVLKDENLEENDADPKQTKVKHKTDNTDSDKSESTIPATTTPVVSLNPDECTWDMLFDDNGDCLDPKIMEELTSAVGSVTIEKPQSDYNRFISRPEINLPGGDDEFSHVIEIYNFPPEFKTQDLLSIFSPYKNGGFEIKWVDDTHALGVFSSSRVAADVLTYNHPFVKTRPLSEATPESRIKAKRSAEFLQPYRARPETCVAMARRLVTGALGMRNATSREEREAERRVLKEAREKKRLAAQQQQDAWEGTIR